MGGSITTSEEDDFSRRILPRPLTASQLDKIAEMLDKHGVRRTPGQMASMRELIASKYAHEMVELTQQGVSGRDLEIRVGEHSRLGFRVRGVDVTVLVWACVEEVKL